MKLSGALAKASSARAIVAILLSASPGFGAAMARAQKLTGAIDCRVVDASGAVLPNVGVVIRNEDQNMVARTVHTNSQGQFTVPLLSLARYSVSVDATGFRRATSLVEVPAATPA